MAQSAETEYCRKHIQPRRLRSLIWVSETTCQENPLLRWPNWSSETSFDAMNNITMVTTSSTTPSALAAPQLKYSSILLETHGSHDDLAAAEDGRRQTGTGRKRSAGRQEAGDAEREKDGPECPRWRCTKAAAAFTQCGSMARILA